MKFISTLLFVTTLLSCSTKKNQLNDFIGTEINIKDTLTGRHNFKDTIIAISNTPKLIAYYDNIGCASCKIKELFDWGYYLEDIDSLKNNNQIDYLFIFRSNDKKAMDMNLVAYRFKRLVYYDTTGYFEQKNQSIAKNKGLHIMLLDKDNKIVMFGNPVLQPELWERYKLEIKRITRHYK